MKDLFLSVKDFLETSPACREAILSLKNGACLVLIIDKRESISVYKKRSHFEVKPELATSYDVILRLDADAYSLLTANREISASEFGLLIMKQILIEKIEIEFHSSLLSLIRKGYFKLLLKSPQPLIANLSNYGGSQLSRIYAWVESRKNN